MFFKIPAPLFQIILLECLFQLLSAAPADTNPKLPFEVDVNSDNTGLDNGLTAQASKQGDNFVASPKPANSQGFSFDAPPEINTNKPIKKPSTASTLTSPTTGLDSLSDATLEATPTLTSAGKKKRKPNGELTSASASQAIPANAAALLDDPFFAYMLQSFLRQQQLMNLLSSGLMGTPNNQFGAGSPFQMPGMPDLQNLMNPDNMELVEDHVLDGSNGNGRVKTYKTKDGSAMVETVTYNLTEDNLKGLQNLGNSPLAGLPAEKTALSSSPFSRRLPSPMNMLSSPRRMLMGY